jgi:hypothetical protein
MTGAGMVVRKADTCARNATASSGSYPVGSRLRLAPTYPAVASPTAQCAFWATAPPRMPLTPAAGQHPHADAPLADAPPESEDEAAE